MTSRVSGVGRPVGRALLLALCLAVTTACISLPTSSPVVSSGVDNADVSAGGLRLLPAGPVVGATPEAVVTGFVQAAAGFSQDHQVARSFLAPGPQTEWRPGTSTIVYSGVTGRTVTLVDTGRVEVEVSVVATIDDEGVWTEAVPGTTVVRDFLLGRVDGQWRITGLDDGILLTAVEVERTHQPFEVWFATSGGETLVPDRRWLPTSTENGSSAVGAPVATALVRSLLAGPQPWLAGAVVSGAPVGTRLALDAAPLDDGVVRVDLTRPALDAEQPDRDLLRRQLEATLGQVPGVRAVELTVDGAPYDVTASDEAGSTTGGGGVQGPAEPVVGTRAVLVQDGVVRTLAARTGAVSDRAGAQELAGSDIDGVALSYDQDAVAVVAQDGEDRLLVVDDGRPAEEVARGEALSSPAFDVGRWLWFVGDAEGSDGGVFAVRPGTGGRSGPVTAGWLADRRVVSIAISREGARVAVVSAAPDGARRLDVAGVVRDETGRPLGITPPRALAPVLVSAGDVAWVDSGQLVVLGRSADDTETTPYLVPLAGSTTRLASVPGGESVTAGDGPRQVFVGTADDRVVQRSGTAWADVVAGSWPTFPG